MPKKYMPIEEFSRDGYLQEVNRRFLHPLGLALEVTVEADGTERISGIWDCREDSAGIAFAAVDLEKVRKVLNVWSTRAPGRVAALGFWVQPETPEPK